MDLPLDKRLRFGFGLILSILLMAVAVSLHTLNHVKNINGWINHTLEVIGTAEAILGDMHGMETGARGHYITRQDRFLEPYHEGIRRFRADLRALMILTADNPGQQAQVERLAILCEKEAAIAEALVLRHELSAPDVERHLMYDKEVMDGIRSLVQEIVDEERRLLEMRRAIAERADRPARTILPSLIVADFLLLTAGYYYILNKLASCCGR